MSTPTEPNFNADAWGIEATYRSSTGEERTVPQSTIDAILRGVGADSEFPSQEVLQSTFVVRGGQSLPFEGHWRIELEDGTELEGSDRLPADLPYGYHRAFVDGREDFTLIISAPPSAPAPTKKSWGWAVQLYALRSKHSWGMGDFGDLRDFAELAKEGGASTVVVNPLHASLPGKPQQPSPYFPSSREFRNELFLNIADIETEVDLSELFDQSRALMAEPLIDRDAIWQLKQDALQLIWQHTQPPKEFDEYCEAQGEPLALFATYNALAEVHGNDWTEWPARYRIPAADAVAKFADERGDRVRFYQWIQWLIEGQLKKATADINLIQDLAIGVNPAGADAWIWQKEMALGFHVGAPPDEFNTLGQDWGLPPFNPWSLRKAKFAPFIRIVRAGVHSGGGLRIDHVMGLFRLFWIPEGVGAADGAYVRYPWQEMLAIVALEAHRANATVVGEDLGTVEPYMKHALRNENILSYKLVWFEGDQPNQYPMMSLGAVTTHDLPTIVGLFSGEDLQKQKDLQLAPNESSTQEIVDRVGTWIGLDGSESDDEIVVRTARLLAGTSSILATMSLEDALGLRLRPNYPGTTDQYPNWSVPLPVSLEDLRGHPLFNRVVEAFRG